MSTPTVLGNTCKCSFGLIPGVITPIPTHRVIGGALPVCTIMDRTITPFGMCSSPANPAVAAATAAAAGVLTPMPCTPITPAPWLPGAKTVLAGGKPMLCSGSKLMCIYGGVISLLVPTLINVKTP